jgi:cob(I)alamin adenosyltransferase
VGDGFTWESEDLDESQAIAGAGWEHAKERIASGDYDLVVLDEVTYPINFGWIDQSDVVAALRSRPESVNVILTGRDAPPGLIEIADTVTEMRNVKHAFDAGIKARRGIDY